MTAIGASETTDSGGGRVNLLGLPRAELAQSIERNVVHGSDSPASAASEIAFFFSATEICPRS